MIRSFRRTRPATRAGVLSLALAANLALAAPPVSAAVPQPPPAAVPQPPPAAVPQPPPDVERWSPDLSVVDGDDVNVRYTPRGLGLDDPRPPTHPGAHRSPLAEGLQLTVPHTLVRPALRVRAELAARVPSGGTVDVEIRGWRAGGGWTEWRDADPAVDLGTPVTRVQVRVLLTARTPAAAPTVNAVRLSADPVTARATVTTLGPVYRIYATREGLVGGRTANGHRIRARDHFVSLPSHRSLAPLGTGDYTVRVCTTNGSRCEYAPVWDVGPWNTRDDYWNPARIRQMWKDLPRGRPEAQAAYQYGYHGGRDQFGRRVLNPSGIDLADGTFRDALRLTGNTWINVAYLWLGSGPRGVVGAETVRIYGRAGTGATITGVAARSAHVPIQCWVTGQTVNGPYGRTSRWDRLATRQYLSHAYVSAGYGGAAPRC
ncbi:hypothetical protein [Micromonospora mirobrigensis]|uniref:Secreted protein n=1 Tax=Micromonospora mirobrigensis TaxID=262898 RepID=A0A1C5A4V1_9ACTN|nr:hypothetical protein [Micromonospora mirobrigensis]SCF40064.1 hypothetical protein GA0070564_107296 [Micromonospora mirobrigensis]